ncbi:MAG: MmgE/PrpD family protein [Rhodospirillaceae bacterium]|nr:MmgE/PrpD family protein [Rhodospirillaceae bacterium]
MPAPITRSLAEFALGLSYEALPAAAVEAIRTGTTDCVAVMFAGLSAPVAGHARQSLGTRGPRGEARIYLGRERASTPEATLANAAAASGSVFDDVAFAGCHTSVVLVPAILAEAELTGASGRDVIRAYAAGYEAWARLSEREKDAYSGKGWHATAVMGAVATAIAVGTVHKLDAKTMVSAIGIAATMSGGITASFDTDAGPFQVARAAAGGVTAVRLAKSGMTSAADALERPGRGLLPALSPKGQVDLDTPFGDLGKAWRLETVGVHLKKYPFGNVTQRALDGMLDLVKEHNLKPADVVAVEAVIGESQGATHAKSPSTIHKTPTHTIELAMAAALIDRAATFVHLRDPFIQRPDVQEVMKKVRTVVDAGAPADEEYNLGFSGKVRLTLADGRKVESPHLKRARGHWSSRLGREELWGKFAGCADGHVSGPKAVELFDALQRLETLSAVTTLDSGL